MSLTEDGYEQKRGNDFLVDIRNRLESEFGVESIDYSQNKVLGVLTAVMADILGESAQGIQKIYDQYHLNNAQGRQLDNLLELLGIQRDAPSNSSVQIALAGDSRVAVPSSLVVRGGGDRDKQTWRLSEDNKLGVEVFVSNFDSGDTYSVTVNSTTISVDASANGFNEAQTLDELAKRIDNDKDIGADVDAEGVSVDSSGTNRLLVKPEGTSDYTVSVSTGGGNGDLSISQRLWSIEVFPGNTWSVDINGTTILTNSFKPSPHKSLVETINSNDTVGNLVQAETAKYNSSSMNRVHIKRKSAQKITVSDGINTTLKTSENKKASFDYSVAKGQDFGPIGAAKNAISTIASNPVDGLQFVTNPERPTKGSNIQTDASGRTEYLNELDKLGGNSSETQRASLMDLDFVDGATVIENDTDSQVTTDGVTVPSHAQVAIVFPDNLNDDEKKEAGKVIYQTTPAGIESAQDSNFTNHAVEVEKEDGDTKTVYVHEATSVSVDVTFDLKLESGFEKSDVEAPLKSEVDDYFDQAKVGEDVSLLSMYDAAAEVPGIFSVSALTLNGPPSDFTVNGNQFAKLGTLTINIV